jgi:hypothetical protein
MDFVLHECLGDYVPLSPRFPSPPCRRSFSPDGCENPSAEEGDSRETVELLTAPWSFRSRFDPSKNIVRVDSSLLEGDWVATTAVYPHPYYWGRT